jgi:oligopeptide/dipeptide ABC transporter ATP-binding protein
VSAPLLRMEHLAVEIDGKRALRDVELSVPAGTCVGLVGETGSGKSMTCRTAIGLLPRVGAAIVEGTIRFEGRDVTGLSEQGWSSIRGRRIGLIPQNSFSALDPIQRVGRQAEETVRALDPDADASARVDELLDAVHLRDRAAVRRAYPHELSGGMRQRVMIALALAGRPDLLLADEATTALDVTIERGILSLLRDRQLTDGMALLLITHDLSIIGTLADSVVIMYAGTTVEAGQVDAVFADPRHPYTRALLAARPGSLAKGTRLPAIDGAPPGLGEAIQGCPFAPRCPLVLPECRLSPPPVETVGPGHSVVCFRGLESVQ